jgi:uncharacterized protein with PQ loop repeat
MEEEKKLTEKESLELITSMINKVKHSYIESGFGPLLWGILITFCSLMTYVQVSFHFTIGFDVWLLSLFALVPQVYFAWRAKKQKNFTSHEEIVMNYVWSTFAICLFLLSFYSSKVHASNSIALYMMIYGMPTFITGGVCKFRPMIVGGIICWVCSIVSYYTDFANGMLLMALSACSAWLIPGIILRRRYLKLKNV